MDFHFQSQTDFNFTSSSSFDSTTEIVFAMISSIKWQTGSAPSSPPMTKENVEKSDNVIHQLFGFIILQWDNFGLILCQLPVLWKQI